MTPARSMDSAWRHLLFWAVLATTGGILFSMALSSIAFGVSVIIFLVMIIMAWRGGHGASLLRPNGMEWYILAWIAAVLLMVVFARYPGSALGSAKRALLISLVYMLPAMFGSQADVRRFLLLLAGIAGLHSLLSIVLFVIGDAARLGIFQHYMTGGGIRMLLLLLLLPVALDRNTPRTQRIVTAIAMLFILFALVLTQTRSSWLAFGAGAVFLGVIRYRTLLLGLAVLALVFWFAAPAQYQNRITHMFTTDSKLVEGAAGDTEAVVGSNRSRLRMLETGWRMFLDHPITGVGDGEMHALYREYVPDAIKDEGGHLHNTYIHVLATHGVVGGVALLLLFFGLGRCFFRTYVRHRESMPGTIALGAMAAFIGFLVNGLAEYNVGDHEIVLMLWMIVGVTVAAARTDASPPLKAVL
ncbi:MAG: O-antigen ligase family protein [Bacteroidia bacterium]|nr:O-antigen ligase family protein [Bacteroidia bacterium]